MMDFSNKIPLVIFLFIVAIIFFWQWNRTRRLHKQFMNQPEDVRKEQESKLYLDPVRNVYVRPQSKWLIISAIGCMILLFVLLGLQMVGII